MKQNTIKKYGHQFYKKPKYKIGDIIVYPDRYWELEKDSLQTWYQEIITESDGLVETTDKSDKISWYYRTKRIIKDQEDTLDDSDIFCKL